MTYALAVVKTARCQGAFFTGARANSALTLQYDDVLVKDGIDSIYFRENHKIKQLKNEASERIVPVHPQLLAAGFSFCKNASLVMQDAGIGSSYINDIIGREDKTQWNSLIPIILWLKSKMRCQNSVNRLQPLFSP